MYSLLPIHKSFPVYTFYLIRIMKCPVCEYLFSCFFKVFYSINLMSVAGGDETMEHSLCKRGNRDAKFATPCSLHTFRQ